MTSVRAFMKIAGKSDVRIPARTIAAVGCAGYQRFQRGEDSVVHVESWTAHYRLQAKVMLGSQPERSQL